MTAIGTYLPRLFQTVKQNISPSHLDFVQLEGECWNILVTQNDRVPQVWSLHDLEEEIYWYIFLRMELLDKNNSKSMHTPLQRLVTTE